MTPDQIRAALAKLGLNRTDAARLLGYGDPSRVSDICTGKHAPHGAVVRLLQAYLAGYRPDDWPGDDAPHATVKGEWTMTYADKILTMPQRPASMIAGSVRDFAAGDAYARTAAARVAAGADAEIARLRDALQNAVSHHDAALSVVRGNFDDTYAGMTSEMEVACARWRAALAPGAGEKGSE